MFGPNGNNNDVHRIVRNFSAPPQHQQYQQYQFSPGNNNPNPNYNVNDFPNNARFPSSNKRYLFALPLVALLLALCVGNAVHRARTSEPIGIGSSNAAPMGIGSSDAAPMGIGSSPVDKTQTKNPFPVPCRLCGGQGFCYVCGGTGDSGASSFYSGFQCPTCSGTGFCPTCHRETIKECLKYNFGSGLTLTPNAPLPFEPVPFEPVF